MEYADFDQFAQLQKWQQLQRVAEAELIKASNNTDAFIFLALATHRLGFPDSAQLVLQRGLKVVEQQSRIENYVCYLLNDSYRWDLSMPIARRNMEKYPADLWSYHSGIESARHLHRFDECIKIIDNAVTHLGPDNVGKFLEHRQYYEDKTKEIQTPTKYSSYSFKSLVSVVGSLENEDTEEFEFELWFRFNSQNISYDLFDAMALFYSWVKNLPGYVAFARRNMYMANDACEASAIEYARNTLRLNDLESTRNICERVLRLDPAHEEASLLLIRAHSAAGFQEAQQAEIERAIFASGNKSDFSELLRMRYGAMTSVAPKNTELLGRSVERGTAIINRPRTLSIRPKIAVCIAGQLRGFKQAFPSLQPLLQQLEADVFVHTWEEIGAFATQAQKQQALSRIPALHDFKDHLAQNNLWAETALPRTMAALDSPIATIDDVTNYYGARRAVVESGNNFAAEMQHEWAQRWQASPNINQCKLLYKVWACHKLAAETDEYDIFIRIRPDLKMRITDMSEILDVGRDPSLVAGSYMLAPEYHGFSDQFAFGSKSAMTKYASIWTNVLKTGSGRYGPYFPELLREEIFFFHLFASGTDMRLAFSNCADALCRVPDVFESNIDTELKADLLDLRSLNS